MNRKIQKQTRFSRSSRIRWLSEYLAISKRTPFHALGLTVVLLMLGCDAWTLAQGTIRDASGKPIPDAVVTMKIGDDTKVMHSIEDGRFQLNLWQPPMRQDVVLTISKQGYKEVEKKLKGPGSYKDIDIILEPVEQLLSADNAYNPIPSPDGKLIAYVRTGWGRPGGTNGFGRSNLVSEVAVISADGTLVTRSSIADTFISGWTEDGSKLICFRDWKYFLVSLDGKRSSEGEIPPAPMNLIERPEWASYSSSLGGIVWSRMVDATASHWAIETPNGVVARTQSHIGQRAVPSPDGRYVAVFDEMNHPTELWVYDTRTATWADLGKIVIHPSSYWHYLQPTWNPWFADSSRLVFFIGSTLVISTPDGRQRITETVVDGDAGIPAPSPDGLSVAYMTAEPRPVKRNASQQFWGNTTIWAISTKAGSTPRPVTKKSEDETDDLHWLGNDTIVFDRIADEVFYRHARIWKVRIMQ